jgi:aminoglycoside phosphotransferase (APT) family kinase protein
MSAHELKPSGGISEEDRPLAARLLAYLETNLPDIGARRITALARIHGGASRATYGVDLETATGTRKLILRLDQAASLIDTERTLEFEAYRSVHGRGVPVPEVLALETGTEALGAAFFLMEQIVGGTAVSPFDTLAQGAHDQKVGEQVFTYLGRIHRLDPAETPLARIVPTPAPEDAARRELDHWAGVIAADALGPMPVAAAAQAWLRAHLPPAPERLVLVHGDYRTGNYLTSPEGEILAIFDWEMAHFGDPLEDLAWVLDPMWSHQRPGTGGGLIARDQAIELWQAASGLRFDAAAFAWWEVFASFKGLAIWTSAAKAYASLANMDPVNAFSGWYCTAEHTRRLAQLLCERAGVAPAAPLVPPEPQMPPPFTPETILALSAMRMASHVAPHLETAPYAKGDAGAIGLMALFAAQRFGREADDLVTDLGLLARLFKTLAPLFEGMEPNRGDDRLAEQMRAAAQSPVVSYALDGLRQQQSHCLGLITRALVSLADMPTPANRSAQGGILQALSDMAERRAMVIPPTAG